MKNLIWLLYTSNPRKTWLLAFIFFVIGFQSFGQMPTYADTSSTSLKDLNFPENQSDLISPTSVTYTDWSFLGYTYENVSPYNLSYYKLVQVNASNARYESILEVSVQGDENYFQMQVTYRIRVDKYDGTSSRFDGLEVQCISGNPKAATFYVYNNALWIRSNFNFGEIYYRIVANFYPGSATAPSPLVGGTFGQTTTAPTGYLASTSTFGLKCDFDHNTFYRLPYTDVTGNVLVNGNVIIGKASQTNSSYKLDVNGNIRANKVVVNTTGADYVFAPSYTLADLDTLDSYIKRYNHLPGISSTRHMQKEGLDVGANQTMLLQKIEELTLYLIHQNKLLKKQAMAIDKLTKRMTQDEEGSEYK